LFRIPLYAKFGNVITKKKFKMAIKKITIVLLSLVLMSFYSCKCTNDGNGDGNDTLVKVNIDDDHTKKVRKIFYNVPSPLEMATMLQQAGANYNPEVLNSIDNQSRYITVTQMALNFGVYGADLSYTRMFDQIQECVKFLSVLRKLSDGIGIPEGEGKSAVNRLEDNIENRDSVLQIISETYANADAYLKENERGNTATLIILGGWVEALYIATNIVDVNNPDKEILTRVGEQKYSLSNLLELLNTYKEDNTLSNYMTELNDLKVAFEKVEITTTAGDVVTDKEKKLTTIQSTAVVKITPENLKEIKKVISNLRNKIVK
jgi:hypothetical protein